MGIEECRVLQSSIISFSIKLLGMQGIPGETRIDQRQATQAKSCPSGVKIYPRNRPDLSINKWQQCKGEIRLARGFLGRPKDPTAGRDLQSNGCAGSFRALIDSRCRRTTLSFIYLKPSAL